MSTWHATPNADSCMLPAFEQRSGLVVRGTSG